MYKCYLYNCFLCYQFHSFSLSFCFTGLCLKHNHKALTSGQTVLSADSGIPGWETQVALAWHTASGGSSTGLREFLAEQWSPLCSANQTISPLRKSRNMNPLPVFPATVFGSKADYICSSVAGRKNMLNGM